MVSPNAFLLAKHVANEHGILRDDTCPRCREIFSAPFLMREHFRSAHLGTLSATMPLVSHSQPSPPSTPTHYPSNLNSSLASSALLCSDQPKNEARFTGSGNEMETEEEVGEEVCEEDDSEGESENNLYMALGKAQSWNENWSEQTAFEPKTDEVEEEEDVDDEEDDLEDDYEEEDEEEEDYAVKSRKTCPDAASHFQSRFSPRSDSRRSDLLEAVIPATSASTVASRSAQAFSGSSGSGTNCRRREDGLISLTNQARQLSAQAGFACPYCPVSDADGSGSPGEFASRGQLTQHIRARHPTSLACPHCGKCFFRRSHLTRHVVKVCGRTGGSKRPRPATSSSCWKSCRSVSANNPSLLRNSVLRTLASELESTGGVGSRDTESTDEGDGIQVEGSLAVQSDFPKIRTPRLWDSEPGSTSRGPLNKVSGDRHSELSDWSGLNRRSDANSRPKPIQMWPQTVSAALVQSPEFGDQCMFACLICDARLTDFDCLLGHLVLVHGQTSAPCATPHCPLCGRACPAGLAALRQHVTVTHLTNVGQIGRGQSSTLDPSSLASLPASSLLPSSCSKASVTPATPLIDQTPPLPSLPPLPLLPPLPPLSILPPLPPLSLESTSCVVPRDLSSLGGGIVSSADANVCGRPPFVCEVCGKQFALRNVINRHRRELHYGVPTKHCPHCPMGYFRQSHLDKHIASKHKQLPLGSATGSNSVNSGSTSGKQRRQLLPALMGSRRSAPLIASRLASDQT